jgi:hypothetical protein
LDVTKREISKAYRVSYSGKARNILGKKQQKSLGKYAIPKPILFLLSLELNPDYQRKNDSRDDEDYGKGNSQPIQVPFNQAGPGESAGQRAAKGTRKAIAFPLVQKDCGY